MLNGLFPTIAAKPGPCCGGDVGQVIVAARREGSHALVGLPALIRHQGRQQTPQPKVGLLTFDDPRCAGLE